MNLQHLSDVQRRAVTTVDGPVLVLAGAGSGKTSVLTNRVAYLINEMNVSPYNILAITFTNKAANEMKERIAALVDYDISRMAVSTFHSMCARFLRHDAELLGYMNNFTIYDSDDSTALIKKIMGEYDHGLGNLTPRNVKNLISTVKNSGGHADPESVIKEISEHFSEELVRIYRAYNDALKHENAMDFDDLLLNMVRVLQENREAREYYTDRFRYILVDEYQDTNNIQYRLVALLAAKHRNLCVVGDDDQSIYKFRGADITNILDFEKQFKESKTIKLEQNYRSTQTILDAANDVIKNNKDRKSKKLWTSSGEGDKITLSVLDDQISEASYINNCIEKLVHSGKYRYNDFAVLYRTNAQTRAFEENLTCPYRILAGLRFYDRKEIKDILAYLRIIYNPADDINLTRIINVPKRGIGDTTVSKIQALASSVGKSMFDIITDSEYDEALGRATLKIKEFVSVINDLIAKKNSVPVTALIDDMLQKTGYTDSVLAESPEEARSRIENIEEFRSKAYEYQNEVDAPTFEGFLDNISLVSDVDNLDSEQDAVVLMTLHSAKGLEFPVVFMCGMEKGLFPSQMSEMEEGGMEEERRLCYVGITRAKKKLYITAARYRTIYGTTSPQLLSPFVDEIPDELIDDASQKRNFIARNYDLSSTYSSYKSSDNFSAGSAFGKPKMSVSSITDKYSMVTASALKTTTSDFRMKKGDRVHHRKFGDGMIVSVTPSGNDHLVEILFDNVGTKNLMASIAKLKKI